MHIKSNRVCIKTRSPWVSLPLKGLVSKHTTVKWTILLFFPVQFSHGKGDFVKWGESLGLSLEKWLPGFWRNSVVNNSTLNKKKHSYQVVTRMSSSQFSSDVTFLYRSRLPNSDVIPSKTPCDSFDQKTRKWRLKSSD